MGNSIMQFKPTFLYFLILPVSHCIITSTVCYGISPSCTEHRLSCPSPLVIQIINTSYGYRPECNDVNGLADCTNTACCNEEPSDCFIPFSSEDQHLVENCSEVEICQLSRLRRYNTTDTVCNGRIVNAYSKIQYDCVIKGITNVDTTPQLSASTVTPSVKITAASRQFTSLNSTRQSPVTPSDSNSGVIGGVLGTLLIISVIINVGLVVYITKKMKFLSSTPVENNYDGITNAGRDQTPPTYDALQVQSIGSSDHDDKKKSDSIHTYYNTKTDTLSQNNEQYYVNMKRT